jgi:hypothetical protein
VSCDVAVADGVASWQQLSSLAKVEPKVGEWLVASANIQHLAADHVLGSARADGATEGLDLANGVRVLVKSLFAEGAQEEESTVLVEMLLEDEFVWTRVCFIVGCIYDLLTMRLHWRNWAELRLHARQIKTY